MSYLFVYFFISLFQDTENDSNKEDSDNASTDELSSDEHNKENNSDNILESIKLKKVCKLGT